MHRILSFVAIWAAAVTVIVDAQPRELGHTVRWDLSQVVQGTALAGGADVGLDTATGDTFTLTGSGDAEPAEADAAGGGTIVHHISATNIDSPGVYVVTRFISWQPGGGQLPVADGIGHASEVSAGVLKMAIRIFLPSGAFRDATLTVNCRLPGATVDVQEGIQLTIAGTAFNAEQHGGVTLFHVQK
jgi:hypothetical protein